MTTKDITIQKDVTPVNLNVTDAKIAELKKRYEGLTASTPKEFKELKAGIAVVRDLRVAVKNRKDELKKPHIAANKAIDAEFNRVTPLLEAIESPLKTEKEKYEEAEKKRKEAEAAAEAKRIANIESRIDAFYKNAKGLFGKTATELQEKIDFFESCIANDEFDYQEFDIKATKAKSEVLAELQAAYKTKSEQEVEAAKIAEQQAEIARQQKELAAERAQIAAKQAEIERKESAEKAADEAAEAAKNKIVIDTQESDAVLAENLRQVHEVEHHKNLGCAMAGLITTEKHLDDPVGDIMRSAPGGSVMLAPDNMLIIDEEPPAHTIKMPCAVARESVTISKSLYIELQTAFAKLYALECAGVDNWSGYGDAMAIAEDEIEGILKQAEELVQS